MPYGKRQRRFSRAVVSVTIAFLFVFTSIALPPFLMGGGLTHSEALLLHAHAASACGNPYAHPPADTKIQNGSSGESVKWLQYELNKHNGANLTVDGAAGNATVTAIKNFQSANGLTADGVAGNATIGKMDDLWHSQVTDPPVTEPPVTEPPVTEPVYDSINLAKLILNSDVSLARSHSSGISDLANAYQNIYDTSIGKAAARSNYSDPPGTPKAPGGYVNLDPRLLDGIVKLCSKYKVLGSPALLVSEIAGGCHSANSRHYSGLAVDITKIGGVGVSPTAFTPTFYEDFRNYVLNTLGASVIYDPLHDDANKSHKKHIHIDWRAATSISRDIAKATVDIPAPIYTGAALKPAVSVVYNGQTLTAGTDYSLTWSKQINVGKGSVKISGKGNYGGTKSVSYTVQPRDIGEVALSPIAPVPYSARPVMPPVTLTWSKVTLAEGKDYSLTYDNNVNLGTATAIITGKGNFGGTRAANFVIQQVTTIDARTGKTIPRAIMLAFELQNRPFNGSPQAIAVKPTNNNVKGAMKVFYTGASGTSYAKTTSPPRGAGSYRVTVDFAESPSNIAAKGIDLGVFQITKVDASTASLIIADCAWTGKAIRPVKIKLGKGTLEKDKDFTVVSYGANKQIGKAWVKIKGKGSLSGAKTVTFKIVPAQMTISNQSTKSAQLKVSWKKVSAARKVTKIQIRYRQLGQSTWKTTTLSAGSTGRTLTNLTKGKKYQVQIRCYKTLSNVNYCSPWSKTKVSGTIQ